MNDEPPIIVQSWYRGVSRRYSHSAVLGMRLWPAAANTPSTSAMVRPQSAERALHALRHQVDDAHAGGDFAEVRFGDADDGGGAARERGLHAFSTGSKTG